MESKPIDSWAGNIGSFPHLTATPSGVHCNLYFTLCTNKYIAYVREHWRCQSWEKNTPVTQSAARTPQSPNQITILGIRIVAQKGTKMWGNKREKRCNVENGKWDNVQKYVSKRRPSKITDMKEVKCRNSKPDPAVLQAYFSEVSLWTYTGEALQQES